MQTTQANASNSPTRITASQRDATLTENTQSKVVNVRNADMESQTTIANFANYQEEAAASTSKSAILLQSIQEDSTAIQKRMKDSCHLELLLKYMFELSHLSYDESKITANDCPAKYYQLDMLFSALESRMAWIRAKTLIAKLIIAEREQNVRVITVEKTWFWKNLADLVKSVVEHQKAQNDMLAHKDCGMRMNAFLGVLEEGYSEKKEMVRRTKRQLCEARRTYTDAMYRCQLEEREILVRLPELLSEDRSILTFREIFHFLSESEIKQLVKSTLASMPMPVSVPTTPVKIMEFKHIRNPVTQLFWDSFLPELSRDDFQKKFLQFICTSWKSNLNASRKAAEELSTAQNDAQRCHLIAKSYFREALWTSATKVVHYILQQSRCYRNVQSSGTNKRKLGRNKNEQKSTFKNLHKVYTEVYEKIYLPYVESQSKNWARLQHTSASQLLIELKQEIGLAKKNRNIFRKSRDARSIPNHLQLINQVLEKLGKEGSIAFHDISELIAKEINETSALSVALPGNLSQIKPRSVSRKKQAEKEDTKKTAATELTFQNHSLNKPESAVTSLRHEKQAKTVQKVDEHKNKITSPSKIVFKLQPSQQTTAYHQTNVISSQAADSEIVVNSVLDQDNLNADSLNWLYNEVGKEVDLIFQDDDLLETFEQSCVAGDSQLPSTSRQELVRSPMFQIDESFTLPDNLFEGDDDADINLNE